MQIARRNKLQMALSILPYAGLLFFMFSLCLVWPLDSWFKAFMKVEQMRVPYLASLFFILSTVIIALRAYLFKMATSILVVSGLFVGQIVATISISVANLFIPNGIDRTIRTIEKIGIGSILIGDFFAAALLGGWLFGVISFIL